MDLALSPMAWVPMFHFGQFFLKKKNESVQVEKLDLLIGGGAHLWCP